MARFGLGENAFLLVLAFLIGVVTAAAAVAFHLLIGFIRHHLYASAGEQYLYGRGLWLLVVIPAAGGLVVGCLSRFVFREREGHGMVDVMESVMRSGGVIRARSAFEKILTSAVTIGSGGSAGAEGPIVQIGAGIASGIGQIFRINRAQLPVLIGCGSAAGISAIFNSPIGGLLFTLEVILQDFSLRTLTPLVIASVIANFTTRSIFVALGDEEYRAIFNMPLHVGTGYTLWSVGNFLLLGIACGIVGASLTRSMYAFEKFFGKLRISKAIKPALGGAMLGVIGIFYVLVFGRLLLDRPKFIPFRQYEMPAFFGDGYGAVRSMLGPAFYGQMHWGWLVGILLFLCVAKVIGTCLTLGSGGAGGVIAPSLFLGAVTGGMLGIIMQHLGLSHTLAPESYALIGMGAGAGGGCACAACIGIDPCGRDWRLQRDPAGDAGDDRRHRRCAHDQPGFGLHPEPAHARRARRDRQRPDAVAAIDAGIGRDGAGDFRATWRFAGEGGANQTLNSGAVDLVVVDAGDVYVGMLASEDIRAALFDREAVPLLLVSEIMRPNVPLLRTSDSLATVLDQFSAHELSRLPVVLPGDSQKVIGVASRAALMRRYQRALEGS